MSTANFHNRNARFIYACELQDEFAYDDLLRNLRAAFRAAAADPNRSAIADFAAIAATGEADGLRGYPGRIIAGVETATEAYRGFDLAISAAIIVRSGYYAGVNLDYDLRFYVDSELLEADDLDSACLPRPTRQWFDRQQAAFTAAIEQVFAEYSTPLRLVGQASNGEAFYRKA